MVSQPVDGSPLTTNPQYAALFTQLAVGSLVTGAAMFALRPWLRRLIDGAAPVSAAAS